MNFWNLDQELLSFAPCGQREEKEARDHVGLLRQLISAFQESWSDHEGKSQDAAHKDASGYRQTEHQDDESQGRSGLQEQHRQQTSQHAVPNLGRTGDEPVLPPGFELDISAHAVASPSGPSSAEHSQKFQYAFTPTQASQPSPGMAFAQLLQHKPTLPTIFEQPNDSEFVHTEASEDIAPQEEDAAKMGASENSPRSGKLANGNPAGMHSPPESREAQFSGAAGGGTSPSVPLGAVPGIFTFANGKQPQISTTGLAAARKLLSDMDVMDHDEAQEGPALKGASAVIAMHPNTGVHISLPESKGPATNPHEERNTVRETVPVTASENSVPAMPGTAQEAKVHQQKSDGDLDHTAAAGNEHTMPLLMNASRKIQGSNSLGFFQSANGNAIQISAEARARAQSLFADIQASEGLEEGAQETATHQVALQTDSAAAADLPSNWQHPTNGSVLSTSPNSNALISSNVAGLQQHLQPKATTGGSGGSIPATHASPTAEAPSSHDRVGNDNADTAPTFQFANGRPLEFSKAGLDRAKELMSDWPGDDSADQQHADITGLSTAAPAPSGAGSPNSLPKQPDRGSLAPCQSNQQPIFQTARCKPVVISAEKAAKAAALFAGLENDSGETLPAKKVAHPGSEVSDEPEQALRSTADHPMGEAKPQSCAPPGLNMQSCSLQMLTAAGKPVTLSSAAKEKAKSLFADLDAGEATPQQDKLTSTAPSAVASTDPNHQKVACAAQKVVSRSLGQQLKGNEGTSKTPAALQPTKIANAFDSLHGSSSLGPDTPVVKTTMSSVKQQATGFKVPRTKRKFQTPIMTGPKPQRKRTDLREPKNADAGDQRTRLEYNWDDSLLHKTMHSLTIPGAPIPRVGNSALDHLLSLSKAEGDQRIPSNMADLQQCLVEAGASQRLLDTRWVANSCRWILWKLSSLAAHWPQHASKFLNKTVLIDELKRRFVWEICNGHHSVLKRVLEQDDAPGGLMHLCIARIKTPANINGEYQVELTDGLYSIRAVVDQLLADQIKANNLKIGDKVRVLGAEISAGAAQMEALEATKTVFLRIHYNGTHRLPQGAMLGKPRNRSTITPLPFVKPGGGPVSRTAVVVVRKYPLQYRCKDLSGRTIIFTPKAHAAALRDSDTQLQKMQDRIRKELEEQELGRCKIQLGKDARSTPGDRRYAQAVLQSNNDAEDVQVQQQMAVRNAELEDQLNLRMQQESQCTGFAAAQKAQPSITLSVLPVMHKEKSWDVQLQDHAALISVHRGCEAVAQMKEGSLYTVTHLNVGRHSRLGRLELYTTNKTFWQEIKTSEGTNLVYTVPERISLQLWSIPALATDCEFDIQGIVVHATPADNGLDQVSQWVFIADTTTQHESDWLLAVHLRAGLHALNFLDPTSAQGGRVAFKNLRLSGKDGRNHLWQATANDLSSVELQSFHKKRGASADSDKGCQDWLEWVSSNTALMAALSQRIRGLVN